MHFVKSLKITQAIQRSIICVNNIRWVILILIQLNLSAQCWKEQNWESFTTWAINIFPATSMKLVSAGITESLKLKLLKMVKRKSTCDRCPLWSDCFLCCHVVLAGRCEEPVTVVSHRLIIALLIICSLIFVHRTVTLYIEVTLLFIRQFESARQIINSATLSCGHKSYVNYTISTWKLTTFSMSSCLGQF